jgi:hypothetical protein
MPMSMQTLRLQCFLRLITQFAAQDFAHIRFGQLIAKLDVFRHFVARELLPGEADQLFFGERRIFFHHEKLQRFAGFFRC